jgi:hypothetical protein
MAFFKDFIFHVVEHGKRFYRRRMFLPARQLGARFQQITQLFKALPRFLLECRTFTYGSML